MVSYFFRVYLTTDTDRLLTYWPFLATVICGKENYSLNILRSWQQITILCAAMEQKTNY